MLGVAIELRTQCGGCGQPLPLNACSERVTCSGCNRPVEISADRWKGLLEDAVEGVTELAVDEGKNQTIMTGAGTYALMYGHQAPRCTACKTNVPPEAAEFADRGWTVCVGCGKRMSIRRAPAALAALGVTLVVGEDTAQLGGSPGAAPKAASPVVLYCPNCKAPLSVDGSTRMCKCQYCSTDVYLPDDLWQRLHPAATVSRWYLWLPDVDVAARKQAAFKYYSLADVVADAQGNLYCAGEDSESDKFIVWCMARDLTVRWLARGLDYDDSNARLALDARNGRLLLWQNGKHSLTVLSAADGAVQGKLGGKQPDDAQAHHLDLDDCDWLAVDADGTILALLEERLVRFSPDGTPIATWPARSGFFGKKEEKLRPIYGPGHSRIDVDGVYIENVGSHPMTLDDYTNLCIGWDGRLYAERSEWVACFDREGKRVYKLKLPLDGQSGDHISTDAGGNLYVLGYRRGDPNVRTLVRVSPDGARVDVIATDRRAGGVLGGEELITVLADGTILLMRYGMRTRVLGPDGRLLYQSDKSKEDDADEDKEIARRA